MDNYLDTILLSIYIVDVNNNHMFMNDHLPPGVTDRDIDIDGGVYEEDYE